jgi:hypothetical protein
MVSGPAAPPRAHVRARCRIFCYPRRPAQSALFDFTSLLVVLLLFICTCAYLRAATFRPNSDAPSLLDRHKHGFLSFAWKAARMGERLSPWVAGGCVIMAVHLLFFK